MCTNVLLDSRVSLNADHESHQSNEAAKWIRMKKITYADPSGKIRTWEMAERQVRSRLSSAQAGRLLNASHRRVPQTRSATASE
jgi:hypothetical protein